MELTPEPSIESLLALPVVNTERSAWDVVGWVGRTWSTLVFMAAAASDFADSAMVRLAKVVKPRLTLDIAVALESVYFKA